MRSKRQGQQGLGDLESPHIIDLNTPGSGSTGGRQQPEEHQWSPPAPCSLWGEMSASPRNTSGASLPSEAGGASSTPELWRSKYPTISDASGPIFSRTQRSDSLRMAASNQKELPQSGHPAANFYMPPPQLLQQQQQRQQQPASHGVAFDRHAHEGATQSAFQYREDVMDQLRRLRHGTSDSSDDKARAVMHRSRRAPALSISRHSDGTSVDADEVDNDKNGSTFRSPFYRKAMTSASFDSNPDPWRPSRGISLTSDERSQTLDGQPDVEDIRFGELPHRSVGPLPVGPTEQQRATSAHRRRLYSGGPTTTEARCTSASIATQRAAKIRQHFLDQLAPRAHDVNNVGQRERSNELRYPGRFTSQGGRQDSPSEGRFTADVADEHQISPYFRRQGRPLQPQWGTQEVPRNRILDESNEVEITGDFNPSSRNRAGGPRWSQILPTLADIRKQNDDRQCNPGSSGAHDRGGGNNRGERFSAHESSVANLVELLSHQGGWANDDSGNAFDAWDRDSGGDDDDDGSDKGALFTSFDALQGHLMFERGTHSMEPHLAAMRAMAAFGQQTRLAPQLMFSDRDFDENDYEALLALDDSVENRKGASQCAIDSLEVLSRPAASDAAVDGEEPRCPICLTDYECGAAMRRLPCKHQFHKGCVDEWLLRKATCPICAQKAV